MSSATRRASSNGACRLTAIVAPEMRYALWLAVFTGQRQADLLALQWGQYRDGALFIKQDKDHVPVAIPCIQRVQDLLTAMRAEGRASTYILSAPQGLPWRKRNFSAHFRETCLAVGIPVKPDAEGLTLHDLRGTAITMLADAGCNEARIASITGHSLRSILKHYLSRTTAQAEGAMGDLENLLVFRPIHSIPAKLDQ